MDKLFPQYVPPLNETQEGTPERHMVNAYMLNSFFFNNRKLSASASLRLWEIMDRIRREETWKYFPIGRPAGLRYFAKICTNLDWEEIIAYLKLGGERGKELARYYELEALGDGLPAIENGTHCKYEQESLSINYTQRLKTSDKLAKRIRRDQPELWQEILDGKKNLYQAALELGITAQRITIYSTQTREQAIARVNQFFDELKK